MIESRLSDRLGSPDAIRKKLNELKAKKEAKDDELKKRLLAQKRAYKKWFRKLKANIES